MFGSIPIELTLTPNSIFADAENDSPRSNDYQIILFAVQIEVSSASQIPRKMWMLCYDGDFQKRLK